MSTPSVYWHRELPPFDEEPVGEHVVEARSDAVPYRYGEEAAMRRACMRSLEVSVTRRVAQEVARLGGTSGHIIAEEVDAVHDESSGSYALRGTYTFVLYRPGNAQAGVGP